MRAKRVVSRPPLLDLVPRICQVREPVLVQAFVPKRAVEAFHVTVLRRSPGCYEAKKNIVFMAPLHQGATPELGTVVELKLSGFSPEVRQLGEHINDMPAADRNAHFDSKTFTRAVIDDRQHAKSPTVDERVVDEIRTPAIVGRDDRMLHTNRRDVSLAATSTAFYL